MFTYRVRPRVFRFAAGAKISVPAIAEVSFQFAPAQPFGVEPSGGRTAIRGVDGLASFDLNTGKHTVQSATPLSPLAVAIDTRFGNVTVDGARMTVRRTVHSQDELTRLVEAVYYVFPLLIAAEFADPPVITEVSGKVNGCAFSWHLQEWQGRFLTTTQEEQQQRIGDAWRRLELLMEPEYRRLVAALHYFHVAMRLERVGVFPGEFLAEAILNYSKVLEVLFSDSTDGARIGLKELSYTEEQIERDYIPAMIIRSKIDVAHVSLSLFAPAQLRTLHRFAERCELGMRDLFERLFARLHAGTLTLRPHKLHGADREVANIIATLERALATPGDQV